MDIKRRLNPLRDLSMNRAIKKKQSTFDRVSFDRLFQLSPDGILLVNQDGTIKISNQAIQEILGLSENQSLDGMNICQFVPPSRIDEFTSFIELICVEPSQQVRLDSELKRLDQTAFPADISMGSLLDSQGAFVQIIVRDITERKLVEEQLLRSNLDLEMAYQATLAGWQRFLDYRDNETGEHSRHLVDMTTNLALKVGMSIPELSHVRHGAILHDIGKIAIPDGILKKPGPLDADEWKIMRKHPTYAYEILSPIEYLKPAIDIPYCHHEKWDGSGYPRGIKGEEIPIAARVFAVIDVWEALNSDRYYRRAWSKEDALEYIRQNSATHFDPTVVDAFLKTVI